jgi:hypothetical protein
MCENIMTTTNYIYLLQEREFIKTKENIYKVGMTKKENHERFNQYPKSSILLFQIICNDCKNIERHVVKKFKETFKQRKDIGNEYFEGDYKNMIGIIYLIVKNENNENECIFKETLEEVDIHEELGEDEAEIEYEICDDDIKYHLEEPVYQIKTYNEWIKYNNVISKVIITNKKREEGFLKFKGQLWRKLYDRNNLDDEEYLLGFIQNFQEDLLMKNKITNEIITHIDYLRLDDIEKNNYDNYINVEYNVEEILKDTLNTCYVKKYDLYNLNYYEYVFPINQSSSTTSYVIYNSINITFTPVDELISNKILTCKDKGSGYFHAKNIINTNIVDDILKSLIPNDIMNEYKKLTYNLIVKQEEKQIIFYDYNDCLLTTWIRDLLHLISNNKFYVLSSYYYDDKIEFRKLFRTHKYRCVVIEKYNPMNVSIEKQIKDFCNLGFKNIIVCQNDKRNTMYNIANFRKHLNDNKEILMKCIKEENNYVVENWEHEIKFDDDIFYRQNLLLTNFLKWCCMK